MSLERLDVTLCRIIYHKTSKFSGSGTLYLIADTDEGYIIKGEMDNPIHGERYLLYGEWRVNPGRGDKAFNFIKFEVLIERSPNGIAEYLSRHVYGLGSRRARAIVELFGSDTLDILKGNPEQAKFVPGITDSIVANIKESLESDLLHDPAAFSKLIDIFKDVTIPRNLIDKLLFDFGSNAPHYVTAHPYKLLDYPRMGWITVDRLTLTSLGYDPRGSERIHAAVLEVLARFALDGDTYVPTMDAEGGVVGLLGFRPPREEWEGLRDEGRIVISLDHEGREIMGLIRLDEAEREIARRLVGLTHSVKPFPFELDLTPFENEQVDAARLIQEKGVCIIAGAPGTGKTFISIEVISQCYEHGLSCCVVTPTGKAAKRADEFIRSRMGDVDIPSTTIHKALLPTFSEEPEGASEETARVGRGRDAYGFRRGELNPMSHDVVLLDEASMVDVLLMRALLAAIAPGTVLIISGDPYQLPSVLPGSVLRDLIMGGLPHVILSTPRRNAGRIVDACHKIKDGRVPTPSQVLDLERGENWLHLEESDEHRIAEIIVRLHEKTKRNPLWDLQVISPERGKKPIACGNLNRLLSASLNRAGHPDQSEEANGGGGAETETEDPPFRKGDKVIRRKNGTVSLMVPLEDAPPLKHDVDREKYIKSYIDGLGAELVEDWTDEDAPECDCVWNGVEYSLEDTYVVNGDIGQILDIVKNQGPGVSVIVQFVNPTRLCRLPYSKNHLHLAYAITAHSAQGSGMPYVILPIHDCFYWDERRKKGLFNRELLYTEFSRAEEVLVTVGTFSTIESVVGRKTIHRRKTRLAGFLRLEIFKNQEIEIK
jgi:exodeoxyribonuclease V alpha subunit